MCDISLLLAIAGLVFIIIDSELTALSGMTGIDKVKISNKNRQEVGDEA